MNPPLPGRRVFLMGSLGALGVAACRSKATNARTLRLGWFPNLTHAPALTGLTSGRFARALGGVELRDHTFNAGPAAIEAMLAGELDATYVGPIPAAAGFIRTRGRALKVVAGAASGGTSFVVRRALNIRSANDLHNRRLASPQVGNTQDIALRHYLSQNHLSPSTQGGDVQLTAVDNANIFTLFRQGSLDGAWVPEPWVSRLVNEAGGEVFIDERDLWPGRAFAITLLVARADYLRDAPAVIDRLVDAHAREVRWIRDHGDEARGLVSQAIERKSGKPLPAPLVAAAWPRIDFSADAQRASVEEYVRRARSLGLLTSDDLGGFFDEARITRAKGLAEAPA